MFSQRQALVVANGHKAKGNRYTMVGPWDAQLFPQGVVFFDKWRGGA
jgi:hypothetical protein